MSLLARTLATIPTVGALVGTYVSTNSDGTVQVDFGEGEIPATAVYLPAVAGTPVRVLRMNDTTIVLGPAVPYPAEGLVTSVGASTAVVSTDIGALTVAWTGAAPSVSDIVAIDTRGRIVGKVSSPASSDYSAPGSPSTGGTVTREFRASDSGSYFGGSWWTNTVRCSTGNIGAWFYGTTIADTIPDAATISSFQVYVPEIQNTFPSSLATIGVHGLTVKSGAPTVTSAGTITAGTGWKTLPNALADALKTGASYGLGTNEGGFHVFAGRASDANSGLLRITYSV